MYLNYQHIKIQDIRLQFLKQLETKSLMEQVVDKDAAQLDIALAHSNNANFKIAHPLLMKGYKMAGFRYSDRKLQCIGLDIETQADTGEPRLLGIWYPRENQYQKLFKPNLQDLFSLVKETNNGGHQNFVVWGNLDIQCIIRMFDPNESERVAISREMAGAFHKGEFTADPPVMRIVGKYQFYVAHYIAGRSLKLGWVKDGYEETCWIFNISQFYPGTIAETSRGLALEWKDWGKESHIIDWKKYVANSVFRELVHNSNKQDARIVCQLADNIQERFYETFQCYPKLLVSTGSLCDAAVGKMLSDDTEDYKSNSFQWLAVNIWKDKTPPEVIANLRTLCSEAFSAGLVDQYAMGYFEKAWLADISAAYPHKIRALHDLRYSSLKYGNTDIEVDIKGLQYETAFIRGKVFIPESLRFHPISIKTNNRENYRPTGSFYASYTIEERQFCKANGATFSEEEYVIIVLDKKILAPIASVSERLGKMRQEYIARGKKETDPDKKMVYNGVQYIIKIVDNSLYGKTVQTNAVIENVEGSPQVTGYVGGDRFNMLYGAIITARTRIQLCEAAMAVSRAGGVPIMIMTDSLCWRGTKEQLPADMIRPSKTAGYFEVPEEINDLYLLKTGQYEYRKVSHWEHKMRGLKVSWSDVDAGSSYFRRLLKAFCDPLPAYTHPKDIKIPLNTRKLITIGSHDMANLGRVQEGITELKPFVMSDKHSDKYVKNWRECIDGHIWLATPHVNADSPDQAGQQLPLHYLTDIYLGRVQQQALTTEDKDRLSQNRRDNNYRLLRMEYIIKACEKTGKTIPDGTIHHMAWGDLERYFGIPKDELVMPMWKVRYEIAKRLGVAE